MTDNNLFSLNCHYQILCLLLLSQMALRLNFVALVKPTPFLTSLWNLSCLFLIVLSIWFPLANSLAPLISVLLVNNSILVQDQRTGWRIRVGHESGGLYHLSPLISYVTTTSIDLAHQCLSHPNLEKLRLLVPSRCTLKVFQYESC